MNTAAATLLASWVTDPDTRRRLEHVARLADLNGHADTAEAVRVIVHLGHETLKEVSK